uniref:Uncharacterized protein n=1 Tax=Arundo donax TaxID=35708 RepID=A0A0A8ZXF9_ARUDO
MWISNNSV